MSNYTIFIAYIVYVYEFILLVSSYLSYRTGCLRRFYYFRNVNTLHYVL